MSLIMRACVCVPYDGAKVAREKPVLGSSSRGSSQLADYSSKSTLALGKHHLVARLSDEEEQRRWRRRGDGGGGGVCACRRVVLCRHRQ